MTSIARVGRTLAGPALVLTLLTAVVTWPQCLHLATQVGAHHDPLFSIWRLGWVAHALATDPRHLFDGNIFYPATNTLTYSDAMMLQGVIGAPLFWANVDPILIYNVLLLGAFVGSGLAMFVLAREVVRSDGAALVAAAIFTIAPYRIEHFMHLELQWAMWVPLTFWAVHRAISRPSSGYGLLAGVFVWLQIISSVYYGVFLSMTLTVLIALLLAVYPKPTLRALPEIALGMLIAIALAVPYALHYIQTGRTLGVRGAEEVTTYSATLGSYLASSARSWLWSWTSSRWGGVELILFPGAVTILLALTAVLYRPRRVVLVYAGVALAAFTLSLGLNGPVYRWLFTHLSALHGLRSPSRFGIIAVAALAMLAAFGAHALFERAGRYRPRAPRVCLVVLIGLIALDNATNGMWLAAPAYQRSDSFNVYKTIRGLGPGPIVELPLPRLVRLPGYEPQYEFWSTAHWQPLVNGYSGYYPPEFVETVVRMEHFPDDRSLAQLSQIGVRYLVVHRSFYEDEEYRQLMFRIGSRPELHAAGVYADPVGMCDLFILQR